MTSMAELGPILQELLSTTADAAGRQSGCVQRERALTGASFTQTLVFGWLANPEGTLEDLVQAAADVGATLSPQALDQRFTPEAADCLKLVLDAAVTEVVSGEPVAIPLLARFGQVCVVDSTVIALPAALAEVWAGCGGSTPSAGAAAVKALVRLDVRHGTLEALTLHEGRVHDLPAEEHSPPSPPDTLRLADLGFFSLEALADGVAAGVQFLSRLKQQTTILDANGRSWSLRAFLAAQPGPDVDQPVRLGARQRLPARLLAQRLPAPVAAERRRKLRAAAQREGRTPTADALALTAWVVFVTSLPVERLSLAEALLLYRVRWQIELLFKLWKSLGQLDHWRSAKPWRILCEVYAKLLGLLITHWLIVTTAWAQPDKSLFLAAKAVQHQATSLAKALPDPAQVQRILTDLAQRLTHGCRLHARGATPSTAQALLALTQDVPHAA